MWNFGVRSVTKYFNWYTALNVVLLIWILTDFYIASPHTSLHHVKALLLQGDFHLYKMTLKILKVSNIGTKHIYF